MDVIVVGCGAAGMAAMRKLHDHGLKVLGLEAADRIGGRVCTVPFGNGVIDMGAAWCHGEKDNKVFELANPLHLLGRPEPDNNWYVLSNGQLVPSNAAESILNVLNDELAKAEKYNTQSISETLRNALHTNDTLKKENQLSLSFVEWFERNNHVGGQTDPKAGKSLRGLIENWNCEGEAMLNWKGRGCATVFDVLLNKYPDPSKEIPLQILLNKEVENIRWGTNQRGLDNPLVHVTCKDGSLYAAKSVIITVSVGVLKERSQWASNPFVRGVYAHRTVALEENGGGAITMSEPLYHSNRFPIVCFAGEATSHHRHTAVHGAVESGFREAERLIDNYKRLELQ